MDHVHVRKWTHEVNYELQFVMELVWFLLDLMDCPEPLDRNKSDPVMDYTISTIFDHGPWTV